MKITLTRKEKIALDIMMNVANKEMRDDLIESITNNDAIKLSSKHGSINIEIDEDYSEFLLKEKGSFIFKVINAIERMEHDLDMIVKREESVLKKISEKNKVNDEKKKMSSLIKKLVNEDSKSSSDPFRDKYHSILDDKMKKKAGTK